MKLASNISAGRSGPPGVAPLDRRSAVALLECLSHPGRLGVYRALARAGPAGLSLAGLAREIRTTGSALTFHLRALETAGLVRSLPRLLHERQSPVFVGDPEPVIALVGWLLGPDEAQGQDD